MITSQKIRKDLKRIMKAVKIDEIKTYIDSEGQIGFGKSKDARCKEGIRIYFKIDEYSFLKLISLGMAKKQKLFEIWGLDSVTKRYYFILCHEVAHYIQYKRHLKWYNKTRGEKTSLINSLKYDNAIGKERQTLYREIKLEHNADKIANILMNKLLKRG